MEGKEGTIKVEWVVVGHLEAEMRTERKIKMWVPTKIRGTRVSISFLLKTQVIREEDVEDVEKVHEEDAFVVPIFIEMEKVIMPMTTLNAKEGKIGELMVK